MRFFWSDVVSFLAVPDWRRREWFHTASNVLDFLLDDPVVLESTLDGRADVG